MGQSCIFSPSKNFQKPKNVGQLTINKSLFKISISGFFVTDNSFNKQNSHTVTLNIERLKSHSQPYGFSSFTMLVSILTLNNILDHYHIFLTNKLIQLALLIFFRNKDVPIIKMRKNPLGKSINRTIIDFLHVFFKQEMT